MQQRRVTLPARTSGDPLSITLPARFLETSGESSLLSAAQAGELTTGVWNHVVALHNSPTTQVYINGTLVNARTAARGEGGGDTRKTLESQTARLYL